MPNIVNGLGQVKVGVRTQVSGGGGSYLLDTYSGATAAYSLRKLRTDYTGSAIRVRRSNDNTTLDVGFDANGNLDTTSMLNFVGGHNQIQYSEEFDNAYWGKVGVTVTANNTIAPDGTMTADLITETVSNSYHVFGRTGASGTWASGTSYNTSVYIKRTTDVNSPTRVALAFDYGTSALRPYVIFNIENGTVESYNFFTDINTGYSITDSGNGWWRISMWGTLTVSRSSFESGGLIRFNNNLSTISTTQYTPLSGSGVYLWGYQLTKLGTNLQPYSKTTTTTAGNGFVSIWYDQSGNNRNLTQTTSTDQPQIATSGSLYLDSSNKPRIKGYTSNTTALRMNGVINVNQPYSSFVLAEYISTTSPTNYPYVGDFGGFNSEGSVNNILIGGVFNNHRIYANTALYNNNVSVANNTKYLYTALFNGTSSQLGVNNNFVTGNAGTGIFYKINLFNTREPLGPAALNGYIYEAIFYSSNQSTNFTPINTNINSYYSIY